MEDIVIFGGKKYREYFSENNTEYEFIKDLLWGYCMELVRSVHKVMSGLCCSCNS